jgi:hypothetical protein
MAISKPPDGALRMTLSSPAPTNGKYSESASSTFSIDKHIQDGPLTLAA